MREPNEREFKFNTRIERLVFLSGCFLLEVGGTLAGEAGLEERAILGREVGGGWGGGVGGGWGGLGYIDYLV